MTLVVALLGVGLAWSLALRPRTGATERVALTLLAALCVVPVVVGSAAFLFEVRLHRGHVWGATGAAAVLGAWMAWRARRQRPQSSSDSEAAGARTDAWDWAALAGALIVGAFMVLYYTHAEVMLGLASYASTGSARCFQLLTFAMTDGVQGGPGAPSCADLSTILTTPGNAFFTGALSPELGGDAFRVLYPAFAIVLVLFTYLLARRWTGSGPAALVASLFCALSPYMLSIEVLDRNVIALALSAALLYVVDAFPGRFVVHGLLLGVAAGTGLRNLPLLLGGSVAVLYLARPSRSGPGSGPRPSPRAWAMFITSAALTFAANLEHVRLNGLRSLGEELGTLALVGNLLTEPIRTPLNPFANVNGVLIEAHAHLGHLGLGLAVLGAVVLWTRSRSRSLALACILVPTWAVLAVQRDWIEGEKARILIWAWLPIAIVQAEGLAALARGRSRALIVGAGAGVVAVLISSWALPAFAPPADPTMDERKPVYQHETIAWAEHVRALASDVGWLPDYGRLFTKTNFSRKWRRDRALAAKLRDGALAGLPDLDHWLGTPSLFGEPRAKRSDQTVDVVVDLTRLLEPGAGVSIVERGAPGAVFVDVTDPRRLLDIYHRQVGVPWQPEPLPVTVHPLSPEQAELGELHVDLNAFLSYGPDEDGFERVHMVHLARRPEVERIVERTAERALPQADESPKLRLRVSRDTHIIIRSWIIGGTDGAVHRVDGWSIELDGTAPRIRSFFREPESYL